MRDRKKQRALKKTKREIEKNINWKRNGEGYSDPTFYSALRNVEKEKLKKNG